MHSLDAYLARIGFTGSRAPTAAALTEIQRRHVATIPFENLDVLLGRPIALDLPSLERKLVQGRRGGYCFEQNTLLHAALVALGFRVTRLLARVRWQVPDEVETALTHMLLLVEAAERRWIADAGFGSGSLSAALDLDTDAAQPTPHEPRRVVNRGTHYAQQTRMPSGEWADLYHFTLQPAQHVDCETGNWWTATHPESRFTRNLTVALSGDGLRHTIFNRDFHTRWTDGRSEHRELRSPDELLDVLGETFGLEFPAGTRFGPPGSPWPA